MRTLGLAAVSAAAALLAQPAHAALTIKFEALATPQDVTGGFTIVISNLPITYGAIPDSAYTECHVDNGDPCGVSFLYRDTAGINSPSDLYDAIMFGAGNRPIFRFANGAFEAAGVYDTVAQDLAPHVGRVTITGALDGPPVDWNPPIPCDPNEMECDSPVEPGGVPEPATWALMILGFGSAGAALRRRFQPAL
jgi:hypothetical protein